MSWYGTSIEDAILCPLPAAYASQDGAWMYPCSGAVSFPEIKSKGEVYREFIDGTFPTSFLSNFVHEATHHYCFDSIVGAVILSARVAAQYGANLRLLCKSSEEDLACLENISCANRVAHSAALALLQPLAEGLAVFGECLAKPGYSEVMTPIPFYIIKLFLQREFKGRMLNSSSSDLQELMLSHLREFLTHERNKEKSQFAATLDVMQAKPPDYSVYWRGFEFIKSVLELLDEDLNDSDVALGFLCNYVFHDYGLAARISRMGVAIEASQADEVGLDRTFEYLKLRLYRLRHDHDYRRRCVVSYVQALMDGTRPDTLNFQLGSDSDVQIAQNYTLYFGLEMITAQLVWPSNSKNRRNLKCGAFRADCIAVSPDLERLRCSFDDEVVEIDALKSGFPSSYTGTEYQPVDGYPSVEFIFLDNYEPAIAFYNAHSLIGLLLRDGKTSLVSPEVDERYGQLSPFAAFQHDQEHRRAFWNPDATTSCGAFFSSQVSKARSLGLELCDVN